MVVVGVVGVLRRTGIFEYVAYRSAKRAGGRPFDPPNIIIGSRSGLGFNDFVVNLGPIVVVLVAVFLVMCQVMFRSALTFHPERVEDLMDLDEREAIRDVPLLVRSGIVLFAVLVGFVLHQPLGLEPTLVSTSAATPPPSARRPTSWCRASRPATATRSRCGSSPGPAWSSPR